ncbi:hypothetical protein LXA43DRAFT_1121590 [Ganoderma leucocontextum]|nr:hypothetical protein LXA43DRAFT_1121590 [Ganoderma leucocontextum]
MYAYEKRVRAPSRPLSTTSSQRDLSRFFSCADFCTGRVASSPRKMQTSTPKLLPTPLPPNPYSPITHPGWHTAFDSCVTLERAASWADLEPSHQLAEASPDVDVVMLQTSPEVAGRTLGYALVHAPNDGVRVGRDCVAREINGCEGDPEILAGLAHVYIFGLIRIFTNPSGPTPIDESPCFAFDAIAQGEDDQTTGLTPKWLTKKLLPRDHHSCALTEKLDIASMERGEIDPYTMQLSRGGGYLRVAHIISQPLSDSTEGICGMTEAARDKLRWASSPVAVLARLAGVDILTVLPNLDAEHPANAFMADHAPHKMFDRLKLWLTPSSDDEGNVLADTYDTHLQNPLLAPLIRLRPQARFRQSTTPDSGVEVPPPSRALLDIHAACAKVAHMSGAAQVLDDFYGEEGASHGQALSRQDMSPSPAGAHELVRALKRAKVGEACI